MQPFSPIDLLLDDQQRVYHLKARRGQLAQTIITVGDPGRVEKVSRHFDHVETRISNREFVTHTGYIGQKRLSVISTGIGTGNIDIVLNEIDSLFNINPISRLPEPLPTRLDLIRIGTSGALQPELAPDSLLASSYAIGLDSMIMYYHYEPNSEEQQIVQDFRQRLSLPVALPCYAAGCHPGLFDLLAAGEQTGITLTTPGFVAAQGRQLLGKLAFPDLFEKIPKALISGQYIQNFEMETAAIYALAKLLGHRALSFSVILPNRATQAFSDNSDEAIDRHIERLVQRIAAMH